MTTLVTRHVTALAAALAVTAGAMLESASPAAADEVWHQSVGRASAEAPCPASTEAEIGLGWSDWGPSWARWANGGSGGWVCDRSNAWAQGSPTPTSTCVQVSATYWVDFGDGVFLDQRTLTVYVESSCAGSGDGSVGFEFSFVLAADQHQASIVCDANTDGDFVVDQLTGHGWIVDSRLFTCTAL